MIKTFAIGCLTDNPKVGETDKGKYATFTVACNVMKDDTTFLPCVCYEKKAELVEQYTRKGSKIAVIGTLRQKKFTTKDGVEKTTFELIISDLQFLERKSDESTDNVEKRNYTRDEAINKGKQDMLDSLPNTNDIPGDLPF